MGCHFGSLWLSVARNDEGSWHYSCIFYKVLWTGYGHSNLERNSLVGTASSGALNCLGKMVENFNSPQIFTEGGQGADYYRM